MTHEESAEAALALSVLPRVRTVDVRPSYGELSRKPMSFAIAVEDAAHGWLLLRSAEAVRAYVESA